MLPLRYKMPCDSAISRHADMLLLPYAAAADMLIISMLPMPCCCRAYGATRRRYAPMPP